MNRQMAHRVASPRRTPRLIASGAMAVSIVVIGLLGAMLVLGRQPTEEPVASSPASQMPVAAASAIARPSSTPPAARGSATPAPAATPVAAATAATLPSAATQPTPDTRPVEDAAPMSPDDFDVERQVIDIAFPLRADTNYHYRDNWYERRDGPPDAYNHARTGSGGQLIRLHDGIDLYAPEGEPVLSPFDGVVIDPATKWTPWQPDRYGLTVVIESSEATSAGYTAILVHLDQVWVDVGQPVTRGQVIGALGRTGDAQDVRPQLHFELRAPFLIDWSSIGEDRRVDAFNPYPSLAAADPKS